MRIGHGFDTHALVAHRPLILGGVTIPSEYGLAGHSDADALLHAVCDALLGAMGQGDIGRHFPDSDPAHAGRKSREFVRAVASLLEESRWRIANIDATLLAQAPRLGPYIPAMEQNLAIDLAIETAQVNIKATTTEHLGWIGRGEGISALVTTLLIE